MSLRLEPIAAALLADLSELCSPGGAQVVGDTSGAEIRVPKEAR